MGGAVAALFLEREHPFCKAILTSPMIAPRHGPIPHALAEGICRTLSLLGLGKRRIFVMREPDPTPAPIERSSMLSPARYAAWNEIRRETPYCGNAAASISWTATSLGITRKILAKGAPERVGIPVRVYAAEREHLVKLRPQVEFARRAPLGEFQTVAGSKHEIYASTDDILHPYLEEVLDFFGEK
jgi:alpha-beta hydrolase superfamily lysophospholipase